MPDRAVAVALRDEQVLVIRRGKNGRAYSVLPGGAVEPGEAPSSAAVRELLEETGRRGSVLKPLWSLRHDGRTAHYFALEVAPGPLVVGFPEADRQSPDNSYEPAWVALTALDAENLQPEDLRALLVALPRRTGPAGPGSR